VNYLKLSGIESGMNNINEDSDYVLHEHNLKTEYEISEVIRMIKVYKIFNSHKREKIILHLK